MVSMTLDHQLEVAHVRRAVPGPCGRLLRRLRPAGACLRAHVMGAAVSGIDLLGMALGGALVVALLAYLATVLVHPERF